MTPPTRASRLILHLILLCALMTASGCSHRGRIPRNHVPRLTAAQLTGIAQPPRMLKDPASGQWAQKPVMEAYARMKRDARKAGFELVLVSGWRSFEGQRRIWNRKWDKAIVKGSDDPWQIIRFILRYTSVPGYSRHHWGTELDLSESSLGLSGSDALDPGNKRAERFYQWMRRNAPRYGFCQPYRGTGIVQAEPWHWSYASLAGSYEEQVERFVDFARIRDRGVVGEQYLEKRLRSIVRDQRKSVHMDCLTIYEEPSGPLDR